MLEGKTVTLRVMEKDDVDFFLDCTNCISGEQYLPVREQTSKSELTKILDNPTELQRMIELKRFIIQRKDGSRIGLIHHRTDMPWKWMEIGYFLIPEERGKGSGTEAVQLMVDYLFLSKDLSRIHAVTDVINTASQKVLEKAGFQREGTMRKSVYVKGGLRDYYLYSILREDWKEPKILTKTSSK